mmetsp:Transcript_133335/g.385912  ORF Transcript_133335/g.385912 Transcript_133335/m.385912 type:complete len:81 (+) Transcript_133335:269-511(+)
MLRHCTILERHRTSVLLRWRKAGEREGLDLDFLLVLLQMIQILDKGLCPRIPVNCALHSTKNVVHRMMVKKRNRRTKSRL